MSPISAQMGVYEQPEKMLCPQLVIIAFGNSAPIACFLSIELPPWGLLHFESIVIASKLLSFTFERSLMLRKVAPTIAGLLLTTVFALENAHAQTGSGGSPGSTPGSGLSNADTGSVFGSAPSDASKANCWVIRTPTEGMAICVFEDPVFLVRSATLRMYSRSPSGFTGKTATIKYKETPSSPETTLTPETVNLRLEEVRDDMERVTHYNMNFFPDGYNPNGSPKGVKVVIGKLKYNRGNNARVSSDVSVRLSPSIRPANPCDEPPLDDIGEEEEVAISSANVPGMTFPLTPVAVTNTVIE